MKRIVILLLASAGICCGQTKPLSKQCFHAYPNGDFWLNGLDKILYAERDSCEKAASQVEALPQYRCVDDLPDGVGFTVLTGASINHWFDTRRDCEQAMNLIAREEPDPPKLQPDAHCTDHISYFEIHLWTGPDGNIKGATEADCEAQLKADKEPESK